MANWATRLAKLAQALGTAGEVPDTQLSTAEMDTDLRLAPDGAGGVEWGTGGSGGGGFVPIVLEPLIRNDQDAGWSTFVNVGAAGNWFAYLQSSGAQNAELTFDPLDFEGGTYKVDLIGFKSNNHGIVHVQLGGTDLTTFDLYAAGATPDQRMTNTGLSISAGTHTVSLQMSTKNASSSSYFGLVNRVIFTRTA